MAKLNFNYGITAMNNFFAKVASAFNATTGHKHTGDTDDAPQIDTSGIKDGAVSKVKLGDDVVGEDGKILDDNLSANIPKMVNLLIPDANLNGKLIIELAEADLDSLTSNEDSGLINIYKVKRTAMDDCYYVFHHNAMVDGVIHQIKFTKTFGISGFTLGFFTRSYSSGTWSAWTNLFDSKQDKIENATKTATSTGTAGQIAYDTNYFYVCTSTNTWKRIQYTAW
jgi:hypothetical protein